MSNLHTREIFDSAYAGRTWEFYRSVLSDCIEYGMPGTWLDLGAGLGYLTECATKFGIKCIGLEGSDYAVVTAKNRNPNIDIRQHFLETTLPFKDNTIDMIICNQVIEHVKSETAKFMLCEACRVLKYGGIIIIYSPCKYNLKERKETSHINLYSPISLKGEIEKAGFKIVCTPNSAQKYLGASRVAKIIMNILFKLFPLDIFSESANCIACKTQNYEKSS